MSFKVLGFGVRIAFRVCGSQPRGFGGCCYFSHLRTSPDSVYTPGGERELPEAMGHDVEANIDQQMLCLPKRDPYHKEV